MPGAYTAKPAAVIEPPDVPDGWDWDWDFPGTFPPGYTPEYTLVLSGEPATLSYNTSLSITANLYDHNSYETIEPSGATITWTATLDGASLNLRFNGDPGYSSSISLSYSEVTTGFWGAKPDIEFDLSAADIGGIVVLTATSTTFETDITDNVSFEVADIPEITYISSMNWATAWENYQVALWTISGTGTGVQYQTAFGGSYSQANYLEPPDDFTIVEAKPMQVNMVAPAQRSEYIIRLQANTNLVTLTGSCTVYNRGVEIGTYSYEYTTTGSGFFNWLTIDAVTGEVTDHSL